MRLKFIILGLIGLPTFLCAQNSFQISSKVGDSVWVEINGENYILNNIPTRVLTNYPMFDTLIFKNEGPNHDDNIICNFKPDSSYSIAHACCGSMDIISASKLQNDSLKIWDYEADFTKIQNLLMDRPFISLRLGAFTKDTIYGWYADMACFPQFKKLELEKWSYGVAEKCFYWNNISQFVFFKSSATYDRNENGIIENTYPESDAIEIMGQIQLRLFDNQRYLLIFDPMSKQVTLEYDR